MIKYSYAMAEPAKDKSKIGKNKKYKNKFKKSVDFCFCLKAGKHFRGVAQLG